MARIINQKKSLLLSRKKPQNYQLVFILGIFYGFARILCTTQQQKKNKKRIRRNRAFDVKVFYFSGHFPPERRSAGRCCFLALPKASPKVNLSGDGAVSSLPACLPHSGVLWFGKENVFIFYLLCLFSVSLSIIFEPVNMRGRPNNNNNNNKFTLHSGKMCHCVCVCVWF